MKLENYLHLYLGCEGIIKHNKPNVFERDYNDGGKAYLSGELYDYAKSGVVDFKPILRPYSSMLLDEMTELVRLDMDSDELVKNIELSNTMLYFSRKLPNMKYWVVNAVELYSPSPKELLWILNKGFDLFGLIENGLAVEKLN